MAMPDNLFSRINISYLTLTRAEKQVADYVKNNPQKVLGTSISDLANLCKVSDTTVFRFCKALKFQGYQDFKTCLAQSVGLDDAGEFRINVLNKRISKSDSMEDVCQKLLGVNMAALQETANLLDFALVSEAVDMLVNAHHIYFFGVGTSSVTAMHAYNKFQRITSKSFYSYDSNILSMRMALMSGRDVVIFFSYSGQVEGMNNILASVRDAGAKAMCITRFNDSPITRHSDLVLLCGADEGPFQAGSMSATIAQLYLVDILYTEFFKRTYDESKKNTRKTAKAMDGQ